MEQEQVNIIMHRMANVLDNMQLAQLKRVLDELSNDVFEDIDSKDILQRFIEIWDSLPQLFILIIIASVFLPTFLSLLVILLLFSWTGLTGMVRAEFLRLRNFEYVKAAQVLGVGNFRIMFKHILPNALVTSITFIPFIMAEAITSLSALDFLGLGLSQDYPSLGDLVRQGKDNLQAPWIGVSIFVVLSRLLSMLLFIGEGVRDVFDTRKNS